MQESPLLSIIIPTLNEESYLPLLLSSIKEQTFKDYEIIVADAKSRDNTVKIAEEFECRLIEGGLPSEGRNRGAEQAKGKIFLFLDADVILPTPNFLENIITEFFVRDLDLATCRVKVMSSRFSDRFIHGVYNLYTISLQKILPHVPGFCVLVKRSLHEAIGGFDETLKLAEDHDYARRGSRIGRFAIFRNIEIPVSTRRFDRDGRLNVALKYLLSELHMITFGPITSDIFRYRFGYKQEDSIKRQ